jgi:hypothetical protein
MARQRHRQSRNVAYAHRSFTTILTGIRVIARMVLDSDTVIPLFAVKYKSASRRLQAESN